jgi:recombination associated protein RdgC
MELRYIARFCLRVRVPPGLGKTMFKNAMMYRIAASAPLDAMQMEEALAKWQFVPCGATQQASSGWVPPRGQAHGPLLELVGGQWFLRLMVESRLLPSSVVRRRTEEKATQIEQETGRKPGKRQKRDIKDEVLLELLPRAFTRQTAVSVWIDPRRRLLVVDAASGARAEDVLHALSQSLDGFPVTALHTQESPAALMTEWLLSGEPPAIFTVDRDCELKSSADDKACVRYARHALDTDEVRAHIHAGKQPTRLALTFASRLSFVLTQQMQLKKLEFVDGVLEGPGQGDFGDDPFDGNALLVAGEIGPLADALIEALGGEAPLMDPSSADAAPTLAPSTSAQAAALPEASPSPQAPPPWL